MILYHFCAQKHIDAILREGLTMGGVTELTASGVILHDGWTWLTLERDPRKQSWAKNQTILPYSRTAWRLTIEIPDSELKRLYNREKLTALYPATQLLFRGFEGCEEWRAFKGPIPAQWIKRAECLNEGKKKIRGVRR